MAEPTNHNEAGEVAPSTVDQQAPGVAEEHAPSSDSAETTDIPTANAPDPNTANPETNPNAAKAKSAEKPAAKKPPKAAKTADDQPAAEEAGEPAKAKAKKEKAPALEDKPFAEFIQQDYLPALQDTLTKQGVGDLQLNFAKQKIDVYGFSHEPECWQVIGTWKSGQRQFNVYFFKEDIQGQRGFSYADTGSKPSILEPFLIDERRITLDLMVFGVLQRLTAQKWLVRN